MKYAMCPKCGRRLCKGENGTKVEMECPKCGENIIIGFTLIPHLIYGIREQYFCTSQLFNIGEKK